jgi:hypothetical protein
MSLETIESPLDGNMECRGLDLNLGSNMWIVNHISQLCSVSKSIVNLKCSAIEDMSFYT